MIGSFCGECLVHAIFARNFISAALAFSQNPCYNEERGVR